MRTAVRKRYREVIDFEQYESRIRKLLDTHISADAVEVVTKPVNIFDTTAFNEAVEEQKSPSSKADLIASQTKRTIVERMEEDPVFYTQISKLIDDAIAEHRAKRLSDNDFLKRIREAAEQMRRPQHDDVPDEVRPDDNAVAIFRVLGNSMTNISGPHDGNIRPVLASAAMELVAIVRDLKVVNWTENADVQNAMRNRMDDYFFDVIRDEHGLQLGPDQIDGIVDSVLKVARARMAA